MNLNEVIARVVDLDLDTDHYAVFGSGPLLARGIIATVGDVDILARGLAWQAAKTRGELVVLPECDVSVVSIDEGVVTIGTKWAIGEIDVDYAIDSADFISGLPWVRLDLVAEYKRLAGRPKDLAHLGLLEAWFEAGNHPTN